MKLEGCDRDKSPVIEVHINFDNGVFPNTQTCASSVRAESVVNCSQKNNKSDTDSIINVAKLSSEF